MQKAKPDLIFLLLIFFYNSGKSDSTTGLWVQHGPTSNKKKETKQEKV